MGDAQLTALDATFLELEEADQSAHMHIGAVMIFAAPANTIPPGLGELQEEILARLPRLPRYRQKLSEPATGGLHWPRWVDDERFDIAAHVRRAALPSPAGEEELREWAGEYFSQRLDRGRPLWEIVLVALSGRRWALVTKTHHCMVDGVGSVDVAATLFDTDPVPSSARATPATPWRPPVRRSASAQRDRGLLARPRAAVGAVVRAGRFGLASSRAVYRAVRGAAGVVVEPDRVREALRRSEAMVEVLIRDEVIAAPPSSVNVRIGASRRLAVRSVPLDELKAIKNSLGGTVNDVVLAAMASGMRDLLVARGELLPASGLRAMVPVNIRTAAERLKLGNRITSLFVHLIIAKPDPLRRYRLQVAEAERLKAGSQGLGSRQIIDLAAHAPPILHTFLARSLFATRLFNVTITNVPGPQLPLYAFGSRLETIWPLVPLAAEHAVGLAVVSYDGNLHFCLNADRDSMRDLEIVAEGIAASIAELGALARAYDAHEADEALTAISA